MAERPTYMGQRAYAVSLAWRVGAFLLVTLGFPLLTVLIMNVSNCRSVGGAVALVSGMALKPVIFLIFVGSITWITVARMRDLGLPGLLGPLVPVLLLMDWQFGVMLGAHWSVGFVMGGLLGAPCQFLSAFLCMGFLACVATREDGWSAAERFGIAGKLVLAVTALILVAGLMRIAFFGWLFSAMVSAKQGTINPAMPLLRIVGIATLASPFLVAIQAGLFGFLIWRSRTGGGDEPALRGLASPTATSVPSFGRRRYVAAQPFTSASISASVGKRPSACLENFSAPSTVMSNTPPLLPRTSSISASVSFCSRALAPRAFGS